MKTNATKINSGQVYTLSVFLDTYVDSWELVVTAWVLYSKKTAIGAAEETSRGV